MQELKIPPCYASSRDGDNWPRHRAKARVQPKNRRRLMAALEAERKAADALRNCI